MNLFSALLTRAAILALLRARLRRSRDPGKRDLLRQPVLRRAKGALRAAARFWGMAARCAMPGCANARPAGAGWPGIPIARESIEAMSQRMCY
jgi:hypothetical protein